MTILHRLGLTGCLLVALLALPLLALLAPAAQAVDIGLEKHSGPGFDAYLPSDQQLDYAAILIVINYADSELTLRVTGQTQLGANKTYHIQVFAPASSEIVEVAFADVETSYLISIEREGGPVLTVAKSRGSYYLPPPRDTWRLIPPETADPKLYSEFDLIRALQSLTIETIALATIVAAAGILLGCAVKAFTKFLVPWDVLSFAFYALLLLDVMFRFVPGGFDRLWYLPLLVGYGMGFLLWHIPYIIPIIINSETKSLTANPLVLYYPEDKNKPCIQQQNNRALFKRWIGIHHELGANAGLSPDWSVSVKKPYWPRVRAPALWLQRTETEQETVRWWRFKLRHFKTQFSLANASRMPYYLWLQTSKSFYDLVDRLEWSENKRVKEHLIRRAEATSAAADMLEHSVDISPHEAIREIFGRGFDGPEPIELNEHELSVIEEAETEPQAEEVGTEEEAAGAEPEETEEERLKKKKPKKKEGKHDGK
ncbi:MAG: hypothetical protein PHV99_03700 [Candidatus Pacebacteria bacterium]|nr:hypothetical protein [Candidatus Paceibacterota bacterium]